VLYITAVFAPLVGAALAGLFGRALGETASQYITSGLVTLSAVLSGVIYWQVAVQGETVIVDLFTWISSGDFDAAWALRFDQLTAVMLLLVTGVAALVHWYSIGYMHGDPGISRFFSYLSLFTFAMLMLVTADNFLQMFFGWEGVGLCSYLLIGFWYDRPAANAAAIKAFVVNRVGDFGFALGIMAIFLVFRTIDFDTAFAAAPDIAGQTLSFLGMQIDTLTLITMLLFIGAMGKSAQLGLHTWLPDAMEGPTPVSALIHAATMVTAGVFMVARLSPIFEYSEFTLMVITIVGATTALVMASVGLVQNDIKRVIAYSTCSQLGYMFFAAGVSAYSASIFHLFTHGFFKALLFLSAGSVIHAMSDEQDMRKMGGLWNKIPLTYSFFWIGSLALAGLPFFAGFYSKDAVLESAWGAHSGVGDYAFVAGLIAAVFTAFYSWRLIFLTFHGESRASKEVQAHVHESPKSMTIPLMILAIGAIFAGFLAVDSFFGSEDFWGDSILILAAHHAVENAHHAPFWVKAVPSIAGIIGIAIAWWMYMKAKEWPHKLATWNQELYQLLLNKWYFDELYDAVLVRPMKRMGTLLWKVGDGKIIDGFGPDGISARVIDFARRTTKLQSGYVYHYAFVMLLGLVAIVSWVVATGGA
jgi:NADH-quinone oxidoreductase subunit L